MRAAAARSKEELGLDITPGRLLVVGWAGPDGVRPRPVVHFVFDGGVLADDTPIRLQEDELDDYRFVTRRPGPIPAADHQRAGRRRAARPGHRATAYLPWTEP